MSSEPARTGAHTVHAQHTHTHGKDCSHTAVTHGDHKDYLHDGHLHHAHGDHVDECTIAVDKAHPEDCTPSHACKAHDASHRHGPACGHPEVPHGEHIDYLVGGHLHHACAGHCDNHGVLLPV